VENRKLVLKWMPGIILFVFAALLMLSCANPALKHLEQGNV